MPIIVAVGDVFKALADPTRRTILDELAERDGQTLFELCSRLTTRHGLGSTRQAISQHLGVLEEAGLIRTRKEGRYKFHDLQREPLERLADRWLVPPGRRPHEDHHHQRARRRPGEGARRSTPACSAS